MSNLYRLDFLKSASVNVDNGSDTITVTGNVDCSTVYQGTAIFINDFQVVEAVSGTGVNPATGESSIKLRSTWNRPSVTAGTLVGFNSIEGLNSAVTRLNEVIKSIPDFSNIVGEGLVFAEGDDTFTVKVISSLGESIIAASDSEAVKALLDILSATESNEGLIKISTQDQAFDGADDSTSMTPLKSSLASSKASLTFEGLSSSSVLFTAIGLSTSSVRAFIDITARTKPVSLSTSGTFSIKSLGGSGTGNDNISAINYISSISSKRVAVVEISPLSNITIGETYRVQSDSSSSLMEFN